jgi:dihydrofolate synthase/folylpolyglutamate synthase
VNYADALAWLYDTQTFGVKLGLENARRLFAAAGHPERRLKFLHVAGTNGKGSTCAMMDSVLRQAGRRSGLYTSPHLVDFRERIRVDGVMISSEATAEGLTLLRSAVEGWDQQPTFFEITTALAAWWFARSGVEVVVWETGMGGRLDATNVVQPSVTAITPIGMDHQRWLGDSLGAIAAEKAGIFKAGVPAVSSPQAAEAEAVLLQHAQRVGCSLEFVVEPWNFSPIGLAGEYQRWNAALAVRALQLSGEEISDESLRRGLWEVQWPARFQFIKPNLVIDGAHNVPAIDVLVETWRVRFGGRPARLVFGALRDKEVAALLPRLRNISEEIWLVPLRNERALTARELRPLAEFAGFKKIHESGLAAALAEAPAGGELVLCAGSLFLAGEALAIFEGLPAPWPSNQ